MSARDPLDFLQGVTPKVLRVMQALGVAESLTDDVARLVLQRFEMSERGANAFLELLHCSNYVVPRNSEWHFSSEVRAALGQSARTAQNSLQEIHSLLLEIGERGSREKAGDVIPAYLFTDAGRAYHVAGLGHVEQALRQYARAADAANSGELWLAGSLAQEQQTCGILPADAIEPTFLRAFAAYRDGDDDGAFPALERIASMSSRNELVAWSMQLIGAIETSRNRLDSALWYLDQSVSIFQELGLLTKLAWTLNTRALALRKDGKLQAAVDDLERAASLCYGDWKAGMLNRLASVKRMLGRARDAMVELNTAAQIATDRVLPSILIQRAGLKREIGDLQGGLDDLGEAVMVCRGERLAIVLNTRAGVFWDFGHPTEALHDLDAAIKFASPESLGAILNTRSCVRRDIGDFAGSLADSEAILAIPPERRRFVITKPIDRRIKQVRAVQAKLNAVDSESAIRQFWYKHFYLGAKASWQSRVWYRAAELAQRALDYASSDDERFECYVRIGMAFEKTAEPERALRPLSQAIELKPDSGLALATLARVVDLMGRPIYESEPYFVRAIEADASNLWAKSWYALALSRAGRHPEAVRYAQEAAHESSNAILIFNLATVLHASPDPNEQQLAIEVARRADAVALPPFNAPALFLARYAPTLPGSSG